MEMSYPTKERNASSVYFTTRLVDILLQVWNTQDAEFGFLYGLRHLESQAYLAETMALD
jgi:hypothetical protein